MSGNRRSSRRLSRPLRGLLWLGGAYAGYLLLLRWFGLGVLIAYLCLLGWACKTEPEEGYLR